jgi:prophage DNA circulation protein
MQATRNWPATLSPASYKGSPFFVDSESLPKSGRFVSVKAYAKSDSHSTEDMGRVPREIRFAAYLASDTADTDAQQFVELCSQPGAGALVLPLLGPYQARCTNCHVTGKKDQLGRVELELEFVEAGSDTTMTATPLGDRLAASALNGMPGAVADQIGGIDPATMGQTGAISHDYEQPTRVYSTP